MTSHDAGYVYGHSHGAGRATVHVNVYQMLQPGKNIKWGSTMDQSESLSEFKRRIIRLVDPSVNSDDVVIVTSSPSSAAPGWFEHAQVHEDMLIKALDSSWFHYTHESDTEQRYTLNLLLYLRATLHEWYRLSATAGQKGPLSHLVLRDRLLMLPYDPNDDTMRTPSIKEYVKSHRDARHMLGSAASEVGA